MTTNMPNDEHQLLTAIKEGDQIKVGKLIQNVKSVNFTFRGRRDSPYMMKIRLYVQQRYMALQI